MKKLVFTLCILFSIVSCDSEKTELTIDYSSDLKEINKTIKDWDIAWETKDLNLAIKHYSDSTDWTNAFGARVQSKEELKELLNRIFNMDFVMSGENNYGQNEINFINDKTATVRSQNIRKNQKWPDGSKMDDRVINHLRIYQKFNDVWLITDHMISQAWPRQSN
ncbi:Cif family virulence factor [Constantimarinum furrinae]|uniref:SnoaL-like domain-containing protein n=1 Tax=Constantimarinum furrinae TaxID=2562285 RepID=A0A7G8PUX2_9FLAO|nr:hypothetical protein [Constantimarinum furrinae]QNJ98138.1 hypothetical protein ALE3EI_1581 [Constantimarinum furrinae]